MSQDRRTFLGAAAGAGAALLLADDAWAQTSSSIVPLKKKPGEKVRFACIGVGGKGDSDTADAANLGELVAICDIDENTLSGASKRYPNAKAYTDWRKLLAEMGDVIDAVTVSVPDHNHAIISLRAMRMGKHVFCQKPLTHNLFEARRMAETARKMRVATQMGNQGTADSNLRKNAARLRAGLLGDVTELHIWTDRPIWAQGGERAASQPVPANVHWDTWLGPAPERPFAPGYHGLSWRGWWDFGTGALGDMGCHTLNMPFMGLDLRNPVRVRAFTSGHNRDSYPKSSTVIYDFAAYGKRAPLTLHWYDGGRKPNASLFDGRQLAVSGALLLGTKGKLYIPGDYAGDEGVLIGGVEIGDVKYPESPGHFQEFVRAATEGVPAMSNFPDYAGPLAEMVLLGNLAVWLDGPAIEWDAKRLRAVGMKELDPMIRGTYRKGWSLPS
ncbi:MAG: Gfo/Idh/MocA family oxidoreductase [Armatimonas sp.]